MERAALRGYATATDLADYLVKKGLPFRDAHEVVAQRCARDRVPASTSPRCRSTTLQAFHPAIGADVHEVLTLRGSLASRNVARRHRARAGPGADRPPSGAPRSLKATVHPSGVARV